MQTDKQKIAELEAENERLMTQWQGMDNELAAVAAAIRHTRWMDPPDGGDTSISEQVKRMRQDAERYRKCIQEGWLHPEYDPIGRTWDGEL